MWPPIIATWTSCLQRQNTAERAQIPGKDGGCLQKAVAWRAELHPAPHAEQSPLCPSAQGGWIGQACGIFAVRCCVFATVAGGDPRAGLLSTVQAVVPARREPIRQDREGLLARPTDSTSNPEAFAPVIVALTESPSVADDRVVPADWTSPPAGGPMGSTRDEVVFPLWQCDKENHGWREGPPLTVPCQSLDLPAGLHPPAKSVSNKKRIQLCVAGRDPLTQNFGRFKTTTRPCGTP